MPRRKPRRLEKIDRQIRALCGNLDRERTAEYLQRHNVNPQHWFNVLDRANEPVETTVQPTPKFESKEQRNAEIRRLRFQESWTVPMIVERLGISTSTVERALSHEYAERNKVACRERKRRATAEKRRGDTPNNSR